MSHLHLGTARMTPHVLLALAVLIAPGLARAASTPISQTPLATASTASTVLPNVMFALDDSGSMAWDYMPDNVNDSNTAKTCGGSCDVVGGTAAAGFPPFYATQFNMLAYNPLITYSPGVNYLGVSLGNASPTAANNDPYLSGAGTKNLVTSYTDLIYCTTTTPTAANLTDTTKCRRNGIGPATNPFIYATQGLPTTTFKNALTFNTNPHYYTITPLEHCTDVTMTVCVASATPTTVSGTSYNVPAPVRYCKATADSNAAAPVSGSSGGAVRCQAKYSSTYLYPRLGTFTRYDIVPATASYSGRTGRVDCAAQPVCTYTEELQNFANWYSYYRTRINMMKTVSGRAYSPLDTRYRIGFITLNATGSSKYLPIDTFTTTQKQNWFTKLYSIVPGSSTPLRQALSRVGRHYAGIKTGINSFMPEDPVQYSCQQNFVMLTTDGYWNGAAGVKLDNTAIGDQDNSNTAYSTRAIGAYDGALGSTAGTSAGSADTLADVAMYYYKTPLRTWPNNADGSPAAPVPTTAEDPAPHTHMTTFTLGLGLDGLMNYTAGYAKATSGDFYNIKTGASGCSWVAGTCNWPKAQADSPSALDDLWHAAVNGHGTYFSAKDPGAVEDGLSSALSAIKVTTGAAAAAATSTPNITPTDNYIFSSTYRTVNWDGEIIAERIDITSGAVIPGALWSARTLLNGKVAAASDTRTIYTFDGSAATKRKAFLYANLTAAEKAYFDGKCLPAVMPQCASLTAAQLTQANDGTNLINWLRGQTQYQSILYRTREYVLGDTVDAKPSYVGAPNLRYTDAVTPNYSSFQTANASRTGVLYIGANDGMLHAFNAATGAEMWGYVPRQVMPNMYYLAADNYDVNHREYVDGSPVSMDVFLGGAWKTILVGGLNAGGRGYYALDVTDPANPLGLWEICSDSTLCAISDTDMGLSFGQPVITKRPSDGKWVVIVSSGYNNISPGTGKGFLYVLDAATGAVLNKVTTNVGDTTTPSGFSGIAGFSTNYSLDNTTTKVYGADLLGNVWRYDMSVVPPVVQRIAQLKDSGGKPQSVTTRPEITKFDSGVTAVYLATGRYLDNSDLQDPATLVPPQNFAYVNSVYAIKDTGADLGNLRLAAANLQAQSLVVIDASNRTTTTNSVDWSTKNGWYVDLSLSPGERVNIDPQLVRGALLINSNQPKSEACASGGYNWFYQFDYKTGSYVASATGGVAGTSSGNALSAGFVAFQTGGKMKYIKIDTTGKKWPGSVNPAGAATAGKRVSWREVSK